jgi:hypothetical protein
MDYIHIEVMIAVPEGADTALLKSQAEMLVPTTFYGIDEIIGRVYVTDDAPREAAGLWTCEYCETTAPIEPAGTKGSGWGWSKGDDDDVGYYWLCPLCMAEEWEDGDGQEP